MKNAFGNLVVETSLGMSIYQALIEFENCYPVTLFSVDATYFDSPFYFRSVTAALQFCNRYSKVHSNAFFEGVRSRMYPIGDKECTLKILRDNAISRV